MNKKRKEIEDKIVELAKKSPAKLVDFVFINTPEYMNAIGKDVSAAIGTYNDITIPWIVATLENYADALRQQMDEQGNELVDTIKKAGKQDVIRMCVPRKKVEPDVDISD